jgi:phosphoribosylaminoimidazole (AIR) synthetase
MGIGYVLIVRPTFADSIVRQLKRDGEQAFIIGEVVKGEGNVRLETSKRPNV